MKTTLRVDVDSVDLRLDIFLVQHTSFSRSYLKTLNDEGKILVNNEKKKSGYKLKFEDEIEIEEKPITAIDTAPENIPLDIQQLSKILGKSTKKVEQVLSKFMNLRMISYEDNCFVIRNWSKYQSADKLEEIRKNNRERQRKFREKIKIENNVTETLE